MIVPDVNVLVYAFRPDAPDHSRWRGWLTDRLGDAEPLGLADHVLAGTVRVLTHPRVFDPPDPIADALVYVETLRAHPACVRLEPGERQWSVFTQLCRDADARGNLVPDAYLAAMVIESGAELATSDRDFARFRGLRWRHPLAG